MFKNLTDMANLLKQSTSIAKRVQEIRSQLAAEVVTGSAGADLIRVEVNGIGEVLRLCIADELFQKHDKELLEELIPVALNDALSKVRSLHVEKVKEVTGGISVPGLDEALGGL
ncbi:MAG: nucleoid-associated protein EbfC [Pirellulaceae bacterium]|nr:MAG: nucleoid-associated protein EbfC [Pirellulaceae bacterium]GIX00851.1 MAG: nucleoid-associated protein EbfC [Pirellulaceae bacterium]GIX01008.1 MAG: nucleoid-associated protein EbfC [Pirellulaceae bacterium]